MVLLWVQSQVMDTKPDFSIGSQLCFQEPEAAVFSPFKFIVFIFTSLFDCLLPLHIKRGFKDTHQDGRGKDEEWYVLSHISCRPCLISS